MRIIKLTTLDEYADEHPVASAGLTHWETITRAAQWKNLTQTRASFPHADQVKVKSARTVTVFNIKGNDYRLITAIHYNTGKVFILNFLPHSEYDREFWKDEL